MVLIVSDSSVSCSFISDPSMTAGTPAPVSSSFHPADERIKITVYLDHEVGRTLKIACALANVSKGRFMDISLKQVFERLGLNGSLPMSDLTRIVRSFVEEGTE